MAIDAIEQSLNLLNTDYMDMVLVHHPMPINGNASDHLSNAKYRMQVYRALEYLKGNTIL